MTPSIMKHVLLSFCMTPSAVHGFSSIHSIISSPQSLASRVESSSVVLFGKNSKKDRLGGIVEEGGTVAPPAPPSRSSSPKKKKSTKSKKGEESTGTIAPGLAEWMAQQDGAPVETSATKKSGKKSDRRVKQSIRFEQEEERNAKVEAAVTKLEEALEENGNLSGILSAVRGLIQLGDSSSSAGIKTLLSSKKRSDYRLAWVGADDAICHLGTGLHKVPLARLQEVFLSCLGRNRLEVSEVIRILGPFPNVRNILQGNTDVGKNTGVESMNIVMDSMVDGTGKEILAGTEDNIRRVNLQIYFCDEKAIVAVVPPDTTDGGIAVRSDPLEDNGAHVLVFVREEELDDKLDQLRVS